MARKRELFMSICFRYKLLGSSLEMVSHGEHSNGGGGECGKGHSHGEVLIVSFFIVSFFVDEEVSLLNSGKPSPGGLGISFNCGFGGSDISICSFELVESARVDEERIVSNGISDVGLTAVVVVFAFITFNESFACSLASGGVGNI